MDRYRIIFQYFRIYPIQADLSVSTYIRQHLLPIATENVLFSSSKAGTNSFYPEIRFVDDKEKQGTFGSDLTRTNEWLRTHE